MYVEIVESLPCCLASTVIGFCMRFFVVHAVHEQTNRSLVSAVKFIVTFLENYYLLLVKRLHSIF